MSIVSEPPSFSPTEDKLQNLDFAFKSGDCSVRLALNNEEIEAAQRLRYHVFYERGAAKPTEEMRREKRDFDPFDEICDHLLVRDLTDPEAPAVVGNYRLLTADADKPQSFFYSDSEYDLQPLLTKARADNLRLMELGRSCVHPDYRSAAAIQLLWRGITAYAFAQKAGVMFGCASFQGVDPDALADPLSYLHYKYSAPPEWRVRARENLYTAMARKSFEDISEKAAFAALPPLLKGYLRLGAYIGDGAVIDKEFSTTDVLIILPVANIPVRYFDFFNR